MDNYFTRLNSIDVGSHIEKKNGLSYLSWAWAWGELKKNHPDATYTVYENKDGWNYHTDGRTCWVKTGVTVGAFEHIEYLPVMDYKNRSIPLEQVTSFDVNKAIQRSLTKAVARHGLGLYIYAGEDLPEDAAEAQPAAEEKPVPISEEHVKKLRKVLAFYKIPEGVMAGRYDKQTIEELTEGNFSDFEKNGGAFVTGWVKEHENKDNGEDR